MILAQIIQNLLIYKQLLINIQKQNMSQQDSSLLDKQKDQPEQDTIQQTQEQNYPQQNQQQQSSQSQITTQQINQDQNNLQQPQYYQLEQNQHHSQQIQLQQQQQYYPQENYNQQIDTQYNGDLNQGQPKDQFQLKLMRQKQPQIKEDEFIEQNHYRRPSIHDQIQDLEVITLQKLNNAPILLSAIPDNTRRSADGCKIQTTIICPNCNVKGQTMAIEEFSKTQLIFALVLCLVFFPLCFIPLNCRDCHNVRHYCRACESEVGLKVYRCCE
ncbi:hypothetical protein pb186bvf_016422 [Paramecium bursaria]